MGCPLLTLPLSRSTHLLWRITGTDRLDNIIMLVYTRRCNSILIEDTQAASAASLPENQGSSRIVPASTRFQALWAGC